MQRGSPSTKRSEPWAPSARHSVPGRGCGGDGQAQKQAERQSVLSTGLSPVKTKIVSEKQIHENRVFLNKEDMPTEWARVLALRPEPGGMRAGARAGARPTAVPRPGHPPTQEPGPTQARRGRDRALRTLHLLARLPSPLRLSCPALAFWIHHISLTNLSPTQTPQP